MTTEERVMTLFAEANPVPDLEKLDLVEVEAATYLATLNTRSSEMTKTQIPRPEESERRVPAAAIAVLAAAAVILGVALVLLNQSEEPPVATDPAPVTTTAPTPTTSSPPAAFVTQRFVHVFSASDTH